MEEPEPSFPITIYLLSFDNLSFLLDTLPGSHLLAPTSAGPISQDQGVILQDALTAAISVERSIRPILFSCRQAHIHRPDSAEFGTTQPDSASFCLSAGICHTTRFVCPVVFAQLLLDFYYQMAQEVSARRYSKMSVAVPLPNHQQLLFAPTRMTRSGLPRRSYWTTLEITIDFMLLNI